MPAPVVLFAYKRPLELKHTLDALRENHLARESDLFVFVDAAKRPADAPKVAEVHKLLDGLTGSETSTGITPRITLVAPIR